MTRRHAHLALCALLAVACDATPPANEDAGRRPDASVGPTLDARVDPTVDAYGPRADAALDPTVDAGPCAPTGCGTSCGSLSDGCGATLDCGACPAGQASSITQYGITWTFDGEHDVGQFVNGDWWVVGPVQIVSVSPEPTGTRNGSMINPIGRQAYDDRGGPYDGDAAVSFPHVLAAGDSLVSSISNPDEAECMSGSTPAWRLYNGDCERGVLHTQAVLTVLGAAAPPDAFRPPYSGADKPLHRVADVCWGALPSLPPVGDLPDPDVLLRHVERPWIDHVSGYWHRDSCATENWLCYGREVGEVISQLAAYVVLDAPQQREIAIRLIQLGIDNWGVLEAGGTFPGNGGHANGHKFPIVFAGLMLGDTAMASPGEEGVGNEDEMTYYAPDGTPRWGRDCASCYFENGCATGGACSGGAKDCRDPEGASDACGDYRGTATSQVWVGEALAIRLMSGQTAWGHDAFFDYVDRWVAGDVEGGGPAGGFIGEVWATYRDATPPAVTRCE